MNIFVQFCIRNVYPPAHGKQAVGSQTEVLLTHDVVVEMHAQHSILNLVPLFLQRSTNVGHSICPYSSLGG